MLFNSYLFLFTFLPIALLGYALIERNTSRTRVGIAWLVGCSLFFYGWWNPKYLILLGSSVIVNFTIGRWLRRSARGWVLAIGVALNLLALGYFKYAMFFVENVLDRAWSIEPIILPLAISFFTFQQIAFLVDARRGETEEANFLDYCLFVTFFPQLIAGPIVHHKDVLPQFGRRRSGAERQSDFAVGATIFTFGLAKKVLIADAMALYATPIFDLAHSGVTPDMASAWVGVLAYTLQIYFDFSGYSDMAIGLGRLFGIRLPLNFASPYKAANIAEFWRRWHMTLSRFLRDYLYIPLGGNRKGPSRRHVNLMLTMLLGGLWHGAGWTFVVWGGLHGAYLIVYHLYSGRTSRAGLPAWVGRVLTLLAVILAWVFFRAAEFDDAGRILGGLVSGGVEVSHDAFKPYRALIWITIVGAIALATPNTQEWMSGFAPALDAPSIRRPRFAWRPRWSWSVVVAVLLVTSVVRISRYSEFIYFQF